MMDDMKLRMPGSDAGLRAEVAKLRSDLGALGLLSVDELPLRYLQWVEAAEGTARRYLAGVPTGQFATSRYGDIRDGRVPGEHLRRTVDADTAAQIDWLETAVDDLGISLAQTATSEAPGSWKEGYTRVFISHISAQKQFASEVSRYMASFDVQGFVAHDAIDISLEWQLEIERSLSTAHAFVGLMHPGFAASVWCQQEVGWALGREMPILMIRMGEDPQGFPSKYQAPAYGRDRPSAVASGIGVWLSKDPVVGSRVTTAMVRDLRTASSFTGARAAAERLEAVGKLSDPILDDIESAYLSNNQLYPAHVGAEVIRRILQSHGRDMPKRSATLSSTSVDA